MSHPKFNFRAERSLKLLLGMRLPRVQRALEPYGFDQTVMDDGWSRLRGLTLPQDEVSVVEYTGSVEHTGSVEPAMTLVVSSTSEVNQSVTVSPTRAALEAVAQRWFVLMRVVLSEQYPQLVDELLRGVPSSAGRLMNLYLPEVTERLGHMAMGHEPFGAKGPQARAVLEQHGLTKQEERDVQVLCAQIFALRAPNQFSRDEAQDERAMETLWAWTLKWSAIARHAIKNKTLLGALGFEAGASRRSSSTMYSDDFPSLPQSSAVPSAASHANREVNVAE